LALRGVGPETEAESVRLHGSDGDFKWRCDPYRLYALCAFAALRLLD